ncbi:hypothetical protein ACRAWF_10135, partial [Streptomyces sp. L7]
MERIQGESLESLSLRFPLTSAAQSAREASGYTARMLGVLERIDAALSESLLRGVCFKALPPRSVLVRPDGHIAVVDFASVTDVQDTRPSALGEEEFAAPAGLQGAAAHTYLVNALRLWLFMPLPYRQPTKLPTLTHAIEQHFPVPAGFGASLLAGLRPAGDTSQEDPAGRAARRTASRLARRPGLHRGRYPRHRHARADGPALPRLPDLAQDPGRPCLRPRRGGGALRAAPGRRRCPRGVRRLAGRGGRAGSRPQARLVRRPARGRLDPRCARAPRSRPRRTGPVREAAGRGGGPSARSGLGHGGNRPESAPLRRRDSRRSAPGGRRAHGRRPRRPGAARPAGRTPGDPPPYGLLHGTAGAALLFLRLHKETGQSRYLDLADLALRHDLARCRTLSDGTVMLNDGVLGLPYLHGGSMGLAFPLLEYLRHRDDPGKASVLAAIRSATCEPVYVRNAGLLRGRAGVVATLATLDGPQDTPAIGTPRSGGSPGTPSTIAGTWPGRASGCTGFPRIWRPAPPAYCSPSAPRSRGRARSSLPRSAGFDRTTRPEEVNDMSEILRAA